MKSTITREFSGRKFTEEDISLIVETTKMYPKLPRKELASTLCELLGWLTPNGKPKVIQCIDYLSLIEQEGLIKLPEKSTKGGARRRQMSAGEILSGIDRSEITYCNTIGLEIACPGKDMQRWRGYVETYHALGDPHVYGSQLRYTIKSGGRDLGCLLFSASSWALEQREGWIGWTAEEKKRHLHLIINNSRFLILPWVRVKNLASRALSLAARQLQKDWLEEYCYAPVLLETFVDAAYKGTSYKAANWIYLGETKGRGRNDRDKDYTLTQKSIYVLPLQKDFRAVLKGEKPFKAVNPDDE